MRKIKNLIIITSVVAVICLSIIFVNLNNKSMPKENHVLPKFVEEVSAYAIDETTDVLIDAELNKNDIAHFYKHGDHWHVFTKDGKEHITYKDPTKIEENSDMEFVSVVSLSVLKDMDVVKILKHGDHYQVFTRDGSEYLTYENPSKLFSHLEIGEYEGDHSHKHINTNSHNTVHNNTNNQKKVKYEIVKILKHGDHYHMYTADGKEFITYTDPRKHYPNAIFGEYQGSHSEESHSEGNERHLNNNNDYTGGNVVEDRNQKIKNLKIVTLLGKEEVNRYDIVKILKHEDHYHIYDSKGREGITYTNPKDLYPNAQVGEYTSNHENHNDNKDKDNIKEEDIKWPSGVTRIVDHGDHWHLYDKDNKEIGIVKVNPKKHYPEAEYIKEDIYDGAEIDEKELFEYKDVEAKLINDVVPFLDPNLLAMKSYGIPDATKGPVYGIPHGYKGEMFFWLHGNHYHAITIKQIIQMQKSEKFGDNSAKDVVATLKYAIQNPGKKLEYKPNVSMDEVKAMLVKHYGVEESKVEIVFNDITIYGKNAKKLLQLNMAFFTKKKGEVIYTKGELPKLEKDNENNKPNTDNSKENKEKNTKKEAI